MDNFMWDFYKIIPGCEITPTWNTIHSVGFAERLEVAAWRVSAHNASCPRWEAPMESPEQLGADGFSVLKMCIGSSSVSVLSIKI